MLGKLEEITHGHAAKKPATKYVPWYQLYLVFRLILDYRSGQECCINFVSKHPIGYICLKKLPDTITNWRLYHNISTHYNSHLEGKY